MRAWIKTIAMAVMALSAASALHARQSQAPVRIASAIYLGDVPTIVTEELQLFAKQNLDLIEPGPLRDLKPDAVRIPKADSPDTGP